MASSEQFHPWHAWRALPCCWCGGRLGPCAVRKPPPLPRRANGRLGRLLIVLMLIDAEVLQLPLLYLSVASSSRPASATTTYIQWRCARTRWEAWIRFFWRASRARRQPHVTTGPSGCWRYFCSETKARLRRMGRFRPQRSPGYNAALAGRGTEQHPAAQRRLLTFELSTTGQALERLVALGIAREAPAARRNRFFATTPICDPQRGRPLLTQPGSKAGAQDWPNHLIMCRFRGRFALFFGLNAAVGGRSSLRL